MTNLTRAEIEAIRGRCEKATKGPWRTGHSVDGVFTEADNERIANRFICDAPAYANEEFIAHARTDVPALLEQVEKMNEVLKMALRFHEEQQSDYGGLDPDVAEQIERVKAALIDGGGR